MPRARLLFIFILIPCTVSAQDFKSLFNDGEKAYAKKDYDNAIMLFSQARDLDAENAKVNYRLGMSYLYGATKSKSLPYLEKAYQLDPNVDSEINYHLATAYQINNKYMLAKDHFEYFKQKNRKLASVADEKIRECLVADSLSRNPPNIIVENMGGIINTNNHEYSPIISADGSLFIFTSDRSDGTFVQKGKNVENFEDIYVARRNGSGWSAPEKISPNINIKYHDAAASLSPDGKTLFLYYEEGNGDIYMSTLENGEWSKAKPLNKNINTHFWETSASISADGTKLYFTSDRPGGQGGLDIYVSELTKKGDWGKAVNLGKKVNTQFSEDSPFIHPDGVTLYFSSNGHPTVGNTDIFKSEFVDNEWQQPENLGIGINSVEYDGFFSMSADKKTGYYSTLREDGMGNADIYKVTFLPPKPKPQPPPLIIALEPDPNAEKKPEPVVEEPEPIVETAAPPVKEEEDFVDPRIALQVELKIVTVLRGKVIDANTAAPLIASISLVDNEKNVVLSRTRSNTNGEFEVTIPHGGNYGVSTEKDGYLFNSINFNVPTFSEFREIDTHIIMVKAEVGSKVVLKNIFFDVGQSNIKIESISELENINELLTSNPKLRVQINGHTDNTGNAAANKVLSLQRATAVVNYLIEKGISQNRLRAVGYGEERPIVSNDDEIGGREINRRTEIEIIEVDQ